MPMSTLYYTQGADYDPSNSTPIDLSSVIATTDKVQIYYDNDAGGSTGTPNALILYDITTGTAYDVGQSFGLLTEHNVGYDLDFHDNSGGVNLLGGDYGDVLIGGSTSDTLSGAAGRDKLTGNGGADTLITTGDGDILNGGPGADTYVFTALTDHRAATFTNFVGDTLDLSAVDANVNLAGDQAFTLVTHFDGHAGELQIRYDHHTGRNEIRMDTDGDGHANYVITVVTGNDFSHIVY
jgi:Ca2+-binding RTX toxin-like protein